MGKQPVPWKEYCVENWYKELPKNSELYREGYHSNQTKFLIRKCCQYGPVQNSMVGTILKRPRTLTLYHTISTFDDNHEKGNFWKNFRKEIMLVICIFSFSCDVFNPLQNKFQYSNYIYFLICKCFQYNILLSGKELTLSQTSQCFYVFVVQVFWKQWGKRRNFSFSQCFLPFWRTFLHFHQTLWIWKGVKFCCLRKG